MSAKICLLHTISRTGSTIISRCLGSMPGVVVLSAVHPDKAYAADPIEQARSWYGLEVRRTGSFTYDMLAIVAAADAVGKTVAVRTWDDLNFFQSGYHRSRLADILSPFCECRRVCLARHPLVTWRSMKDFWGTNRDPTRFSHEHYCEGAEAYAKMCGEVGFVKYEKFCERPELVMRAICHRFGITYDPEWQDRWKDNHNITGDPRGIGGSEGISETKGRTISESDEAALIANPHFLAACRILEYTP